MQAKKVDASAAKQKIAKLSISDSFIEMPSTTSATCSSVMPDDFDKPQVRQLTKASRSDIIRELNSTVQTLHRLLRDYFPATQDTLPAKHQSTDDLLSISLSLNNYVATLNDSLRKTSQSSYRIVLDSAQKAAVDVHVYKPQAPKLNVLDKVFSKQDASYSAEETQALASLLIGAIRDSASEDLKKRMAVLQNSYVRHSEDLLILKKLLRKKEDVIQELTQRMSGQMKE